MEVINFLKFQKQLQTNRSPFLPLSHSSLALFRLIFSTGENITIPCILATSNEVECHWLKNSQLKFPVEGKYHFNRVASNGDCSIRISNLNVKDDDGDWQCQVYLKRILIAPSVRVTILVKPDKPRILYQSRPTENGGKAIVVEANKTVQIECVSENGNPLPRLDWILNGKSLEESRSFRNMSTGLAKTTLNYVFDKTMNRNSLVCNSYHQLVQERDVVELNVVYRPEVHIGRDVVTVDEGSDLRDIFCRADANPPVTSFRWLDTENRKILFSDQPELHITNINKDYHNKVYECQAENEIGRSNVDSFRLNVLYEPRIVSESDNQRIKVGRSVSLSCQIDANPAPSIVWYHLSLLTGDIKRVQSESSNPSILLIKNVTYADEGE